MLFFFKCFTERNINPTANAAPNNVDTKRTEMRKSAWMVNFDQDHLLTVSTSCISVLCHLYAYGEVVNDIFSVGHPTITFGCQGTDELLSALKSTEKFKITWHHVLVCQLENRW